MTGPSAPLVVIALDTGDHEMTGRWIAEGPAGDVGQIDLLDLAPTFLSLLDRPAPPSMRGRNYFSSSTTS